MTPDVTPRDLTLFDLGRYHSHLRAQGYALATIRAKVGIVDAVARTAAVDPRELTIRDVEAYFARDLGPWSRRKYLEHLRDYGHWAGLEGLTAGLRSPKAPKAIPKPCSEHDLAALLATSTGRRSHHYVIFGAYAGMRSHEIAAIRGSDLEPTDDGWNIRIHGKGDREDVVPVGDTFSAEFLALRAQMGMGRLFPGCTANAVQLAIRLLARNAGVVVSVHQLRHRFGTMLYRLSGDLLLVQRLMRHDSPVTTAGYALLLNTAGATLVAQLPVPALFEASQQSPA